MPEYCPKRLSWAFFAACTGTAMQLADGVLFVLQARLAERRLRGGESEKRKAFLLLAAQAGEDVDVVVDKPGRACCFAGRQEEAGIGS